MSKKDVVSEARRNFFKKAGLGVGALGAATLAGSGTSVAEDLSGKTEGAGYRETDHVKKYYELAKF
ncbi:formate dehydrogenase [Rhodovibrionaceae bacterium A322]